MQIRVADYVMNFLAQRQIKNVYTLAGGGSMYLLDALGHHPDLRYICNHHEQASAMSAEADARVTRNFGVCLVSTGPATTNTLTGVLCAWNDSIPVMFISGQANSKYLIKDTGLRQHGVHEADIVSVVSHVVKYAVTIDDAEKIRYYLERSYTHMMEGRKGPVWLDIPLDIQNTLIDPDNLAGYIHISWGSNNEEVIIQQSIQKFNKAHKPAVLIGAGCSNNITDVLSWATINNLTILSTKNIYGQIPRDTKNYMGMIGIYGNRKANLALQDSGCLLILGARLPFSATGYAPEHFAPKAYKIRVDIDEATLTHSKVICNDIYCMSIEDFFNIAKRVHIDSRPIYSEQYADIEDIPDRKYNHLYVNSYNFYKALSNYNVPYLVTDQGAAFYSWSQAYDVKKGTLSFTNGGFSPMGYGLPAAIGACIAGKAMTVLVTGEGSFELNIQELQTIRHYNLPIKCFVFENGGYGSIKNTQDAFCKGYYVGSDNSSGLTCVDPYEIAMAYHLSSATIETDLELSKLEQILSDERPMIIKVKLDPHQEILPKVKATINADGTISPGRLEKMAP
jgi:acetolactate synthase-1/2/3 large subunit